MSQRIIVIWEFPDQGSTINAPRAQYYLPPSTQARHGARLALARLLFDRSCHTDPLDLRNVEQAFDANGNPGGVSTPSGEHGECSMDASHLDQSGAINGSTIPAAIST
jgi:hypothetical protein